MGLWRESGTAAIVVVVGCSLSQGLYCLASGASVDDLVCQYETDSSIYQYRIVCVPLVDVYLVAEIVVYFLCVGHGVDIVFLLFMVSSL